MSISPILSNRKIELLQKEALSEKKNYLGRSCWWYSKHVPINVFNVLLALPIDSSGTVKLWLILIDESFGLLKE